MSHEYSIVRHECNYKAAVVNAGGVNSRAIMFVEVLPSAKYLVVAFEIDSLPNWDVGAGI
jgi:hypothetical protein